VTRWTLRARTPRNGGGGSGEGGGGSCADGAEADGAEEADDEAATPRHPPRSMRRALLLVLQRPERMERTVVVPSSAASSKRARAGSRAGAGASRTVQSLKPAPALNGDPLAEARRDRAEAHAARRAVPLAELTRSAGGGWQPWPALEAEAAPGEPGGGGVAGAGPDAGAGAGAGRFRGPPPMLSAAVLRHRRCVSAPCLI